MTVDYSLLFEAVTAAAALAVPVVVAVMAHRFNNQLKRWEASQWRNQELIKARLEYYRELVPQLNDMMCFFAFVGGWKEMTPPAMVKAKRSLDRAFFCAAPLFDPDVHDAYTQFMLMCFVTHNVVTDDKWGSDAKFRTGYHKRKKVAAEWDNSWETLFVGSGDLVPDKIAVVTSYDRLIAAFARNIELSDPRDRYIDPFAQVA